jgi:hypothetical protein
MKSDAASLRELLNKAYLLMGADPKASGPKPLARLLNLAIQAEYETADPGLVSKILASMFSEDPNHPVRGLFGQMLRTWDFAKTGSWATETAPNTTERRYLIYELLQLTELEITLAQRTAPFADLRNSNIVIAEDHEEWFEGERRTAGFYWKAYERQLRESGWNDESVGDLSEASDLVLERLSDPRRAKIFATRGLVVGYVQSGKTANFTAVVAKAADAGYRLLIILAGTLDVLRSQTQRRIDKELVGKELISAGVREGAVREYAADTDWDKFIEHGALPSQLGYFDIERLTGALDDFISLRRGNAGLEFRGPYQDRPYNHPDNLARSPARLIVMKKIPARIKSLVGDLKALLHTGLSEVPALIIDDESDQASVNTTKLPKPGEQRERTATNREIVSLLKVLPRAQYVGYTATPFANVFIDPTDEVDLFPRDFLVGLKKPAGYMGVRDFFDFDTEGQPLEGDDRPIGFESNERAFLRDIRAEEGEDDDAMERRTLLSAIDSFLITGALKLYRHDSGMKVDVKHHTMLVHRSTARTQHARDRELVLKLFDDAEYGSSRAQARLERLWREDFYPVCRVRASGAGCPESFSDLHAHLAEALRKIRAAGSAFGPVRIVNAESGFEEHAPDFDREPVWSILVGGAKLSRGFTIEGLTISYFRRRVKTADTLMQTGRWFGFRRGYRDLVRVYLGRVEPDGRATFDLMEAFKAICQDEESFRSQLRRYMKPGDGKPTVKPRQVPPLVAQHLLQPAAKNKMYNAIIRFQNFGGEFSEPTRLPQSSAVKDVKHNAEQMRKLLAGVDLKLQDLGAGDSQGRTQKMYVGEVKPSAVVDWISDLRWADKATGYVLEKEYLLGTGRHDPGIARWLFISPQVGDDIAYWSCGQPMRVVRRSRVDGARFKVFTEPRHRAVADAISGIRKFSWVSAQTAQLVVPGTAVLLFYPVVTEVPKVRRVVEDHEVSIGTALHFPPNRIQEPLVFGVQDADRPLDIVISRAEKAN